MAKPVFFELDLKPTPALYLAVGLEAGAVGLAMGPALWPRPLDQALEMLGRLRALLGEFPA